jgi:hypothetical protein
METLLGIVVMALSVVGSFEALRLADLKARHARVDNRITELVRENSDYVLFVAYDLLPQDGGILSQGSLYQLYDAMSQRWESFYYYTVVAQVGVSNPGTASEAKNITLKMNYQVDGDAPGSPLKSQTIASDVIKRRKS